MSQLAINKTSLKQERDRLKLVQRFLPSLDLKKQQLLTEHKAAQQQLAETETEIQQLWQAMDGLAGLLGATDMDLSGLIEVESVILGEQNVVGARLPVVSEVKIRKAEYSTLAKPFWVDFLVDYLERLCTLRIHLQVRHERIRRLRLQVRRITQRVNLFEKVLIPVSQENIKRIQLGLSERERSAVIRIKLAKKKRAT